MKKENSRLDVNLQRAGQILNRANQRVEQLEFSPENAVVGQTWEAAKNKFDLPIYTYLNTLLNSGVDETTLVNLTNLLIDLRIDVSDPHASSSELSVMVGFISQELLGTDLGSFRRAVDEVRLSRRSIRKTMLPNPSSNITYSGNTHIEYGSMQQQREWERQFVLSPNNYVDISKVVLESNNQVLREFATGEMQKIWNELGITRDSKAVLFFRDLKTYAGDVDFYYWGSEQEEVTLRLSRYLTTLGYKVDHRSNLLVESIIRDKAGLNNSYLASYLYMYFFMGKSIEFNGDSFGEHYKGNVLPAVSMEAAWPSAYKSIMSNSYVMENIYSEQLPRYPGFKDVPFRLVTAVLMGLSIKYDIPYTLDFENFLTKLDGHLKASEIDTLRNSIYYINQIRNLYQLVSDRRWEIISPETLRRVSRLVKKQGGQSVEKVMRSCASTLRSICLNHLSDLVVDDETKDLIQNKGEVNNLLEETYDGVADRYKALAKRFK